MTDLLNNVQNVFRKVFDRDDLVLRPEMTAADVENWDSMAHIQLIFAIEREFKIKFQNSEIKALKKVGDIVDFVQAKTKS